MSRKTRLYRAKTGRTGGKARPEAEKSASPRITVAKWVKSKNKRQNTKRKRCANLNRSGNAREQLNPVAPAVEPKQLTPSQQNKIIQAETALNNPNITPCSKGKQHSSQIIMLMIRVVSLFVTLRHTITSACQTASKLFGASRELIRQHVMLWYNKKEIRPVGKKRGQGSARYDDNNHILKHEHLSAITKFVDNNNKKAGGMTSVRVIRNHLLRTFGVRYKRSAIYYALRARLGYRYAKPTSRCVVITEKRRRRLRKHYLQRDLALKLQARGEAIIVYMDESYVHQNHFPKNCWFHPDRPKVTRPAGKGKRLIIIYAITVDGLLRYCPAGEDNPPAPGEFDSGIYPTSEMVYRAKSARGDYHDQMDCDTFMLWMQRRLVPAFESKYPGKTMILCLDNAPYHHGRHKDGFWCKEHNKSEIARGET